MTTEHKITMSGGRYYCTNESCDFDTLNRWSAEMHIVEESDEPPDFSVLDAPNDMLRRAADSGSKS